MITPAFPKYLIDQIADGNVVLFLGSGFSFGAMHPENHKMPIGQGLSDLIAEKFLDDSFKGQSLMHVSQIAISETGIFEVQKYISDIFSKFKPANFHKLLPTFKWKSIYTTNYDFIVEDVYENYKTPLQQISRVIRNTKDFNIYTEDNSLPYYKLHGCLSNINDEELPLILTPDQYITHLKNRERLFEKLYTQAWNHTVLFIGFSFADTDILTILHKLDTELQGRSRFYFVGPYIRESEIRFWETKAISGIKMSFEEFIQQIDKVIPIQKRKLSSFKIDVSRPVFSRFFADPNSLNLSEQFISFIDKDIEYIHVSMTAEVQSAKEFYKGYFENWDPIIRNLDATRDIKDAILSETILQDHYSNDTQGQFLFLIKGHAGSGKSVLLKRVAWDTAIDFEKFCIFYNRFSRIRYENIVELYNYVKQRIFVFIDNAMSNEDGILMLIDRAKKDKIPLTIFTAERANVWNNENNHLKYNLNSEFAIEYLSNKEIQNLLSLLERHNSLGYLENKSQEQRVNALRYRPGFELLVTLYEATHGKPLKEIINNEYDSIYSEQAKSLYLTVSLLHRLNTFARAGLIARVHGISLDNFRTKLNEPLAYIVFDRMDYRIQDYVYHTRHPYIAELLVESVLVNQEQRLVEYCRILSYIDTDFEGDRIAFMAFTNAKKLLNDFTDYQLIRKIYDVALEKNPNSAALFQQMAIFEAETGNLASAERFIKIADDITNGQDSVIQHTFAELEYKKAENSKHNLEKKQYLDRSIRIADRLTKGRSYSPHSFHTILKSIIMKMELSIEEDEEQDTEQLIKDFERKLREAKQAFPYQDFILEIEARFNELFNNTPVALDLLEKAHKLNPSSPFITGRVVAILEAVGNYEKVEEVLTRTLKHLPGDKEINLLYAQFLSRRNAKDYVLINHYLAKSYTEGDNRPHAQFLHARTLFLSGEVEKAKEKFRKLGQLQIDPEIKNRPVDTITENGKPQEFQGRIRSSEYSYGFITRDQYGDDVFYYRTQNTSRHLQNFSFNEKVKFNLAFNYKGLIAINVQRMN